MRMALSIPSMSSRWRTSDVHAWNSSLEGIWIMSRDAGGRIDRHSDLAQEIRVGRKAGHHVDEICFDALFAAQRGDEDGVWLDRANPALPMRRDASLLFAI